MDKRIIGLKIKELRSKKSIELGRNYTGQILAEELGISRSYLGDIESGRTLPSPELISKLTEIFKVSKDYFYNVDYIDNDDTEFDEEIRAIARDLKSLPNDKKDLLKKLIKTMSESADEELDK